MFEQYHVNGLFDEMFVEPGPAAPALRRRRRAAQARSAPPPSRKRVRMADVDLPQPGHHLHRLQGRGRRREDLPVRPGPAHRPRRRVGHHRARPRPAHHRAEPVLPATSTTSSTSCKEKIIPPELIYGAKMFRREMFGVNVPRNIYIHICGTDLIRDRDGTYYGAGGQRPHAQRRELRAGEPRGDEAASSRRCSARTACGRSRTTRTTCSSTLQYVAPRARDRPDRRRPDAGHLQLGLLRAQLPGAADGRRAGRGPRPGRREQLRLHAHDRRACGAWT